MKYLFTITVLLLGTNISAQTLDLDGSTTRAVVVGISDYQDAGIPDLRFADRDAEAFANFLRSPAGGSLDGDHLKLLTNQNATAGRIAEALDALIEQAKEGDQVIIYFSGHGDVEGKKLSQPGFLLCWDSPSRVYMGGGTYSLAFLQEVVSTLSVQNKAKVVVITDACHAGKLSGSQIGGAQLISANLAKQYANEIKILSCQPNEYSLEGEQWGGGRGCFSYHLVEGLFGLADRNGDQTVTVGEIDRYLEDHVTAEAAPQSQVPMLLGNKTERLATVDAGVLAELQKNKSGQMPVFAATEGRGFEDEVLAKVDTSIREMYRAFKLAVEEKRFLAPAGNCAEDYYAQLVQVEALAPLRGMMKRNYAAALIDEGQQIVNSYLKGDLKTWEEVTIVESIDSRELADQFYRAAELLGDKHYFYSKLKANALFFESYAVFKLPIPIDSAFVLKVKLLRQAVALDPVSPHIWDDLAYQLPVDSVDFYIEKLTELAPNWPVWYFDIGFMYEGTGNQEKAVQYFEKAIALDSTYLSPLNMISYSFEQLGRKDEATRYKEAAVRMGLRTLENDSTGLAVTEWSHLVNALLSLQRFEEAEDVAKKMIADKSTGLNGWFYLGSVYSSQHRYEEAEITFKKLIALDTTWVNSWYNLGHIYNRMNRHTEAVIVFKKALSLDSLNFQVWLILGAEYIHTQQYSEAEQTLKKAISLDSTFVNSWSTLGSLYIKMRRYTEAEPVLKKAISLDSTYANPRKHLGMVCFKTGRPDEARQNFLKALELNPNYAAALLGMAYTYAIEGKMEEALAYVEQAIQKKATYEELQKDEDLAPLRATPEWKALMKKHFPDQVKD